MLIWKDTKNKKIKNMAIHFEVWIMFRTFLEHYILTHEFMILNLK